MLLVLAVHADVFSLGVPTQNEISGHPVSSFMRFTVESLALVCVNVYILISGYFGIKLKKRSIASFLFMVIFWRWGILLTFVILHHIYGYGTIPGAYDLIRMLVPGYCDWFVGAYILLMFLSPMLNSFIEKTSIRGLWLFAATYCGFQMVFDVFINVYEQFGDGYSVLSFIGLYILGSALRRTSQLPVRNKLQAFGGYLLVSVVAALGILLWIGHFGDSVIGYKMLVIFMAYNGPAVMLASVLLFIGFRYIKLQSRTVNTIAASTFAVYLFHMHPMVAGYYKKVCVYLFDNFTTAAYIPLIIAFIVAVFTMSILIDFMRRGIWNSIIARFRASIPKG